MSRLPRTISTGPRCPRRGERRVGHARRRQAGDEQRDEAQAVGDDRARALRQAVTDRHTEQ